MENRLHGRWQDARCRLGNDRLGGKKPVRVDVRVIAATNGDLAAAVKHGTFRADLFYRLNVFPVDLPPLSDRTEMQGIRPAATRREIQKLKGLGNR